MAAVLALGWGSIPAGAQEIVPPPAIYPADTWQGRTVATVRVLDTLDSRVQVLAIPVGQDATFRALTIHVGACRDRPATLTPDAAGWLAVRDTRQDGPGFSGWMLAGEPFLGVFQDPVYAVRLIGCAGDAVAPVPPPLAALAAAMAPPADQPVPGTQGADTPAPGAPASGAPAPGTRIVTVPAASSAVQPAVTPAPAPAAPVAHLGGAPLALSPPDESASVPAAVPQPSGGAAPPAGRPLPLPPPVPFATGTAAPARPTPASSAAPASQAQPGQPQSLLPP
ncbi:DUF2155 domain-containing protein [Gluconacetobacter tumulicola]|uniref:DUF2155 domain-containing protein n=1 Tax=Gluconacetobacter tumulicola TaxID=1017177 RepID=A0A7W4JCL5_9PROT|nr:DUF2155 domain-containing protein [Gluconacetobacter tumulicola]